MHRLMGGTGSGMQKRGTFDHLFECLGGDYPLLHRQLSNERALEQLQFLAQEGKSIAAENKVLKKFQAILSKVLNPATDEPY